MSQTFGSGSKNQKSPISRQKNIIIEETDSALGSPPVHEKSSPKRYNLVKRLTNLDLFIGESSTKPADTASNVPNSLVPTSNELAIPTKSSENTSLRFQDTLLKNLNSSYSISMASSLMSPVYSGKANEQHIQNKFSTNLMTPVNDSLSRKSSYNSVRFAPFLLNDANSLINNQISNSCYSSASNLTNSENGSICMRVNYRHMSASTTSAGNLKNDVKIE